MATLLILLILPELTALALLLALVVVSMADRDKKISAYVTEQRKREVDRRADEADMTVSSYLNQLIAREMRREAEDELSAETRAAENLQQIIDRGVRDLRDATADLHDITAKSGAYSIANFEFLKQEHKEPEINDALRTGARRLRDESDDTDDSNEVGEWDSA